MVFRFMIVFIIFIVLSSAIAENTSTISYSELITFESCEYQVNFPTKTKKKSVFANGINSIMVQSIYDGKSPFMRAECFPLAQPKETLSQLRNMLENQARISGIDNPEITIDKSNSKLGVIGTYSGIKKAGGFDFKYYGKVIVGKSSLLSLLAGEELKKFPSDKTVYFLNTVDLKR